MHFPFSNPTGAANETWLNNIAIRSDKLFFFLFTTHNNDKFRAASSKITFCVTAYSAAVLKLFVCVCVSPTMADNVCLQGTEK
jgi:hypothetical protein